MKITFVPAVILAVALSSAVAFAANTITTGIIKSVDAKTQQVTLVDGTSYMLPKGFDAGTLKAGEKVVIAWYMSGKQYIADTVKAAS